MAGEAGEAGEADEQLRTRSGISSTQHSRSRLTQPVAETVPSEAAGISPGGKEAEKKFYFAVWARLGSCPILERKKGGVA